MNKSELGTHWGLGSGGAAGQELGGQCTDKGNHRAEAIPTGQAVWLDETGGGTDAEGPQ